MRFNEEEKTMWLEDWRHSGKSAWGYAKENGLNPQTFVNWTKAAQEAKSSFVELPVRILPPTQLAPEILIEKGDVKILVIIGEEFSRRRRVRGGRRVLVCGRIFKQ